MKVLRIFSNALLVGLYSGAIFLLLFFYVNPDLDLDRRGYFSLFPFLGAPYVLGTAGFWTLCLLAARPFWVGPLTPRWLRFRYTVWMMVANLTLLAILFGASWWQYRDLFPPALARILMISTTVLLGLFGIFVAIALSSHRRIRRHHRFGVVLAGFLGLFLLWWLRASYPQRLEVPSGAELQGGLPGHRTFILGIDSASMDLMVPLVAEGKLPTLSRMIREGASGRLGGFRPASHLGLWASLSTGEYPFQHGQYGERLYRTPDSRLSLAVFPWGFPETVFLSVGFLREASPGTPPRRAKAFWEILGNFGEEIRVENWEETGWEGSPTDSSGWRSPGLFALEERMEELSVPDEVLDAEIQEGLHTVLVEAVSEDLEVFLRTVGVLESGSPKVLAVRLRGLDRVSHAFLRYHLPEEFGNVPPEVIARTGGVLEAYYRFLDDVCGVLLDRLPTGGRLLVVSPNGIEPMGFPARILARFLGDRLVSGAHTGAPEGVFFAVGEGIRPGARVEGASILDFVPTLLYSLGLPVGRDMGGRTLTEIFEEDFTREHAVFLIPSYETARVRPTGGDPGRPEGKNPNQSP